uniref:Uncharacterized protein n=1 Tax=viral metagenome TaxID=1070528 RepID=A0A6M3LIQ2_9ZZZZ
MDTIEVIKTAIENDGTLTYSQTIRIRELLRRTPCPMCGNAQREETPNDEYDFMCLNCDACFDSV